MTETTNLFSDSAEPLSKDGATPDVAAGSRPESGAAGSTADQAGAARSRAGSPADDASSGTARGGRLPAMLLPELQRLAQSLGIAGTGRMRKGQLIAAIEDRQHGGGAAQAPVATQSASTGPAVAVSGTGRSLQDRGQQSKANGNSVKRTAPAGAGANRPFEQDAMESEGSGQLSMVSDDTPGLRAGAPSGPVTGPDLAAAAGQPHSSAVAERGAGPVVGDAANGTDVARASQAGSPGGAAELGAGPAEHGAASAEHGAGNGHDGGSAPVQDGTAGAGQEAESGSARRDSGSRRDGQRGDRRSRNGNGRRDDQARAASEGSDQSRDAGRSEQQGRGDQQGRSEPQGRGDQQRDSG